MFGKLSVSLALVAAGTFGAAALAAGAGMQAAPPAGPGLDLINERCGFCHTTEQATGIKKTPADWASTVQSMIDRGAELTPAEQKTVTDYLSTNNKLEPGQTAPAAPAQGIHP